MKEWISKEIVEMDEFLSSELAELRDYIIENRNEDFTDISVNLHVYEERVLFYYEFPPEDRTVLPWSVIGTYETEENIGDLYQSPSEQKRKVKEYFMKGWLEDQLWDADSKEQQEEKIPEGCEKIGLFSEDEGYFFWSESVRFSNDSVQKYWEKYRKLKPSQRSQRTRFTDRNFSRTANDDTWHIYVTSEFASFYYDRKTTLKDSAVYPVIQKEMKTIGCSKKTETVHAVIANYISWQEYLWACRLNRNGKNMKPRNNCLEQMKSLYKEANEEKNANSGRCESDSETD